MAMKTDDWTDILNLAQALMPEPPTALLNQFICDESDLSGDYSCAGELLPQVFTDTEDSVFALR